MNTSCNQMVDQTKKTNKWMVLTLQWPIMSVIKSKLKLENGSEIYDCDTMQIVYDKRAKMRPVIHFRMFHNAELVCRLWKASALESVACRNGEQWLTQINKTNECTPNKHTACEIQIMPPKRNQGSTTIGSHHLYSKHEWCFYTNWEWGVGGVGGLELSGGYDNGSDKTSDLIAALLQRRCCCWGLVYRRSGLYFKLHSSHWEKAKRKKDSTDESLMRTYLSRWVTAASVLVCSCMSAGCGIWMGISMAGKNQG